MCKAEKHQQQPQCSVVSLYVDSRLFISERVYEHIFCADWKSKVLFVQI